jgi:putative peptidoglycan lipid II flippase
MITKAMGRAISGVVLFTMMAKVLGFVRELALSYYFGATGISDAYLISQTIPGTIFQFVGTGLTTCFIPIYYKVLHRGGKQAADDFTNVIITLVLSFSTAVILVIYLFTPEIVHLFAMGFEGDTLYYACQFTRIGVLSLYFSTFIYVYNSYLQANNIFTPTAFAAVPNSIAIILSIVLGALYNIWILSIGSTLAVGFQLLFILYPIYQLKFHFHFRFTWRSPDVQSFFMLLIPVVIGVSVNEINTLVDRTIASNVAIGGISALTYANSLIMLIQGGIVQPIATVCYPKITDFVSKKNEDEAKIIIEQTLAYMAAILIPITLGFMVYQNLIVTFLFGRGKFGSDAIQMTGVALFFYAIGILFVGAREAISRYYYAHSNTKIPVKNATIGVIINIAFNLIFSSFLGIAGLALATSLSAMITAFLLFVGCNKYLHCGKIFLDVKDLLKVIFFSILAVAIPYLILVFSGMKSIFLLVPVIIIAVIIYATLGIVFRIKIFGLLKKGRILR